MNQPAADATESVAAPPSPLPAAASPRKRLQRSLWIAGPLLVAIVGLWVYLDSGRYAATDNAYLQADQVTIAAQVAGRVVEVAVTENQFVHQGELLFRIDPEPLRLNIAQLRAQLAAASDSIAAQRDRFHSSTADVRAAEIALKYSETQLQRMQDLRGRGLVAQKMLDDASNDVAAARGKRDAAAAALAASRSLLGGAVDTPTQQLSSYQVVKAQLDKAELDLQHAEVRAPIDGSIGQMHVRPGDYLEVGAPAMPLVATTLWVEANFKETDLAHVHVGQRATVKVDTFGGHEWPAQVTSISPASGAQFSVLPAQNATGNWVKIVQRIPVRLSLDMSQSGDRILRAGMSAEVSIDTGAEHSPLGRLRTLVGNDRTTR